MGHYNALGEAKYQYPRTSAEQSIIEQFEKKQISSAQAEARLRRIASPEQLRQAGIRIEGKADVNVTVHDTAGKKIGQTKVTTDLFGKFTTPAPQTKGQHKNLRGGQ
jgi:hypothetical protein